MAFQLRTILLPTDFSDSNLLAAREAGALARRFHAAVTLLHVNGHAREQTRIESFAAAELDGIPVTRVLSSGDPAAMIVASAERERSDLIAMPTHGYGPVRRFLLG